MNQYQAESYDVIVVGAGHAGSEAAIAAARMGVKTLLLTINLDMVAFMPCNPSVGGPAKGVVVREIDALGGEMGKNIDKTYIQMRMLNTGKGPAVRALRAQADKHAYATEMKHTIEKEENLTLRQGIVEELIVEDGVCRGVVTSTGAAYRSQAVVITAGTALRGEIIIGELKYSSGPNNSQPSVGLANHLKELGLEIDRFKTGTPPRVKSSTIDYSVTEEQPGDKEPNHFSYSTPDSAYNQNQEPCWLTYTNETTHEIIQKNLHRAPMFTGIVEGVGARYCPSIEDKIVRFADKPRHQLFLEPEGLNTEEVYVQGLSTSLPEDVQTEMLHSIEGLEKVEMMRTGYAIEYDVVVPHQLRPTLETKVIENLYTAGQTNGTSGYEEAAGQGLMAGINAALKIQEIARLGKHRIKPTKEVQAFLETKGAAGLKDGILARDFLKRPEISYQEVAQFIPAPEEALDPKVIEQVEIQIKYEGYIKKAMEKVEKLKRMEAKRIPENIDYQAINGLATEAKQKLQKIQPETIAQASRISGVNPADISILMVYIEQGKIAKVQG